MAAAEDCPDMVFLLQESESEVNSCNNRRRTPLMEAAIWGRAENIKILLRYDADKALKDRQGCVMHSTLQN